MGYGFKLSLFQQLREPSSVFFAWDWMLVNAAIKVCLGFFTEHLLRKAKFFHSKALEKKAAIPFQKLQILSLSLKFKSFISRSISNKIKS